MIRLLWLFLVVAAIALAAAILAAQPGAVAIDWGHETIHLTLLEAAVIVFAVVVVLVVSSRAIGFIVDWPGATSRWRRDRRRRTGYLALARGMVAVAAGDARAARRFQAKAKGHHEPLLSQLLAAQTAQLEGDDPAAVRAYVDMLGRPETEFLGLRGLFIQASRHGEGETARRYVTRAYQLKPDTPWVLMALFDLDVRAENWPGALRALAGQSRHALLDAATVKRRRAVLDAAAARDLFKNGHRDDALVRAKAALAFAPGLQPAALVAAMAYRAQGRVKRAAAVIEKAWRLDPHPDLALAYSDIHAWPEPRFDRLIALNPQHAESWLLSAAEAAQDGRYREAAALLKPLLAPRPLARACRLMADIARVEGDEPEARLWTERALSALRDGVWRCSACRQDTLRWTPACPHCGAFDTLGWNRPPLDAAPLVPDQAAKLYRLTPPAPPPPPAEPEPLALPPPPAIEEGPAAATAPRASEAASSEPEPLMAKPEAAPSAPARD